MAPVRVTRGDGPVILALPHGGTWFPDGLSERLTARGQRLVDTDWHIARVYEGLLPGATTVAATFHRYVIDANRPPSGESLYPGRNTTGLVPLTDFDGQSIWKDAPTTAEIAQRLADFHSAYHAALAAEITRVRASHGVVLVWDCHSIRSEIPFLFEGRLPDFNIGTVDGTSCAVEIADVTQNVCEAASGFTTVLNGRFKGGWTTRHWGRPSQGIHAMQMELAQRTHLASEAPPFAYDAKRAARLRPVLATILTRLAALLPSLKVTA